MSRQPRIYLDNAATTWPKPEAVYTAVDYYQRELGTSPARGVYAEAVEADRIVDGARRAIAGILGAEGPRQIAFAFNGTDALNLAIHGVLAVRRPCGHYGRGSQFRPAAAPLAGRTGTDPGNPGRL